eukprot:6202459-Pleurochrysis_carterae.AAC.1
MLASSFQLGWLFIAWALSIVQLFAGITRLQGQHFRAHAIAISLRSYWSRIFRQHSVSKLVPEVETSTTTYHCQMHICHVIQIDHRKLHRRRRYMYEKLKDVTHAA